METLPIAGWILGGGLTAVGLVISWFVWRRRGAASGLRGVAWSLLPLAAGLVGLLTTIWRVGYILVTDLVGFFVGLALNPVVWAGVILAGLAVVLWIASGVMRARGIGTTSRSKAPKAATDGDSGTAVTSGQKSSSASQQKSGGGDEDFGDIEDLLRKHGIE
ncbi:cellulose synthase [Halostreptopolyspora alba]|uniref:Cellulose synthase n=1 Tax=Halostreptopolyspora alba TaxID=2487137 RepID=A0A3N0E2A3_9ACTN|nr:cellulose synthase [Nocardiopsaceae bacterium YIM 96095]